MKTISAQAAVAQEAARQDDGKFGTQAHADPGLVSAGDQPPTFYLEMAPGVRFQAVEYGGRWNGWATPVVTRETLAKVIELSEEPHHWDGDALVLERDEEDDERYVPRFDGLYDAGELGWTFNRTGDWDYCDHDECLLALDKLQSFTFDDPDVDPTVAFIRKAEAIAAFTAFGQDSELLEQANWYVFEDDAAQPGEAFVARSDAAAATET